MNDIIATTSLYSFLAFPPALLILKFITKKPRWWLVVLFLVLFVVWLGLESRQFEGVGDDVEPLVQSQWLRQYHHRQLKDEVKNGWWAV